MELGKYSFPLAVAGCAAGVYLGETYVTQMGLGVAGFLAGVAIGVLLHRRAA
jgi:hypothetical protein